MRSLRSHPYTEVQHKSYENFEYSSGWELKCGRIVDGQLVETTGCSSDEPMLRLDSGPVQGAIWEPGNCFVTLDENGEPIPTGKDCPKDFKDNAKCASRDAPADCYKEPEAGYCHDPSCPDPRFPYKSKIAPNICYANKDQTAMRHPQVPGSDPKNPCNAWCCTDDKCTATSCEVQPCTNDCHPRWFASWKHQTRGQNYECPECPQHSCPTPAPAPQCPSCPTPAPAPQCPSCPTPKPKLPSCALPTDGGYLCTRKGDYCKPTGTCHMDIDTQCCHPERPR